MKELKAAQTQLYVTSMNNGRHFRIFDLREIQDLIISKVLWDRFQPYFLK